MKTIQSFTKGSGDIIQRKLIIYFKAHEYPEDGKVPSCANIDCSYEGAGKDLCKAWAYELKQCAIGYFWCGDHSYDAEPVPCGTPCEKNTHDCMGSCS
jgi:hypothetical protein